MTATGPALSAAGVHVAIGGRDIVTGVDLEVDGGEIVALVGPNGCGKSTLLSGLAGVRRVSRGAVRFAGVNLSDIAPIELARLRALVTQLNRADTPFLVHEVVEMGRFPWTRTAEAARSAELVEQALTQCDLQSVRDRPFSQLSGGQQARVSLARALAQQAPVLMLDEPTAALDIHHQERLLTILADRRRTGAAILIVVHDLSLAAAYADRVLVMKAGRIVASGPTKKVMNAELLSQIYDHPVLTWTHPDTGQFVVLPDRTPGTAGYPPPAPRRPE
ncbi:iron complex transport system ATP-binding protein [Williamsia limnetica]|uniref:Iron complex transport system ATP-binding protein n=1 Tax=Williamsia limnetica TaxID=882452 RepID=A0A318RV34_WILLI|nr:iron complex transport system ATP-binding protein [Williamsia limnetica]